MNRKYKRIEIAAYVLAMIVCLLLYGVMRSVGVPYILILLLVYVISAIAGVQLAKWEFQNKHKETLALIKEGRAVLDKARREGRL